MVFVVLGLAARSSEHQSDVVGEIDEDASQVAWLCVFISISELIFFLFSKTEILKRCSFFFFAYLIYD